MKNIQITISKKLLFIFLINSFVTIIITGLVIQSFTDISGSIQFTSKSFSFFKSNLDYIRLDQEKLKNTNSLIDASIENALKTKNKLIQSSNNVKDLTERLLEEKFSLIHSLSIEEEIKVIDQINKIGELNISLSKILQKNYIFLRLIENGLRLIYDDSTNLLDFKRVRQSTILQLLKLQGYSVNNLREAVESATIEIREIYLNYF